MGKNATLEATPPGFTTRTHAVPAFATSDALIVVLSRLWEMNSVTLWDPFHSITARGENPVPLTSRTNPLLPGFTLAGTSG
jgi:hypothetical protein